MSRRPCRTLLESLAGTSLRCRLGDRREGRAEPAYALGEHLDERSHTRAVVGALVAAGAVASEGAANLGVQLRGPAGVDEPVSPGVRGTDLLVGDAEAP